MTIEDKNKSGWESIKQLTSLEIAREIVSDSTFDIVEAFFRRQDAMQDIANAKIEEIWPAASYSDLSVIRFDREAELIEKFTKIAVERGEDPQIIKMLIWYLMFAWKSKQLQILWKDSVYWKEYISDEILLTNLLELTAQVADSYDVYGKDFGWTTLVRKLETDFIRDIASQVSNKKLALDLWSANGHITEKLQSIWFERIIWYELCPEMIKAAKKKNLGDSIDFIERNIFDGIPQRRDSIDFIVANFWAGSEVHKDIISEVDRVLRPWWKAVLSFYNTHSVTQSWWQPLQNGIEPILNPKSHILEVPIFSKEWLPMVYKIYAQPYSTDDITSKITQSNLDLEKIWSFSPALTLTPPAFFESQSRINKLEKYEKEHYYIWPYIWFYLTVVVSKK